ncbi:amidohydrolase family protein [Streptomyces huiliensis]|uniref:amidohydrolase family protein n=1 Tax=Streptomyces huiliensis TaxID=2876027 RepID=UPI001CBDE8A0|nr:amidohydrolase family protein [Streptomyces huiliensis]MBZ4321500.1 amidohydrolase [Streptomyces huiliensis]
MSPVRDDEITGFWRGLGLPGLIDVHTHFMPERVLTKVWSYFDAAGEQLGRAWPITYRDAEDARVRTLRSFGVRAFTSMIYPHKPGMADWLNAWAADFAARTPDCLHTATFFPEPGAVRSVRAALDAGARIFKAHLQVGAYDPRDPLLDGVWGLLAEAGVPVVTHCGSGPLPGRFTGPEPIGRVLVRHPGLRLVVAHMGVPEYGAFLDLAERYPEVHLDTTMVFTDFIEDVAPFPAGERPRLAALGDRILFGSDFPNIPYGYGHALTALTRLGQDEDWLRAVCHDNAARLLGVPDPGSGGLPPAGSP